jgi:hypothetical protein
MGTMKKPVILNDLILCLLIIGLWIPRPASGQEGKGGDSIAVTLTDDLGAPLAGIKVSLYLYQFGQTPIRAIPSGRCRSGADGHCQIVVKKDVRDQSGFYRGYLAVGSYGKRPVLWPGGELSMNVWLNEDDVVDVAGESGPYDWQEGGETPVVAAGKRFPAAKVAIVLVVLAIWLLLLWWKGRR